MAVNEDIKIREILQKFKTIAVVGCSRDPEKEAHKEPIDIVDVFRPSEECLDVAKEAVKINPKVIWMQLGIKNEEAAKLAEKNGIKVIMDRCIMIEHKR